VCIKEKKSFGREDEVMKFILVLILLVTGGCASKLEKCQDYCIEAEKNGATRAWYMEDDFTCDCSIGSGKKQGMSPEFFIRTPKKMEVDKEEGMTI
jgi:hypothetical protein